MNHHCHALGCKKACAPRLLMCLEHWSKVPLEMQKEVYRTVKLRRKNVDSSWAPWWRAAHKAIHHIGLLEHPNEKKAAEYLKRQMDFADYLESGKRDAN